MKRAISVVLQLILMLAVFLIGSFLPAINILPTYSVVIGPGRIFIMDGLVLMFLLYLFILLIAAARKRIRITVVTSTIAFVLALALGLAMKFGFKSV